MNEGEDMSGIHDCAGDAAAYVLGALDLDEAEAFQRHLEECVVCRDEVQALQGAVDVLPMASPQLAPSSRLRRRVLRAIRSEPKTTPIRRRPGLSGAWSMPALRGALAMLAVAAVVAGAIIGGLELSSTGSGARLIQARVTGISGSAQLRVKNGRAQLVVRHLSPPPAGHVYEVWLKPPGAPPTPANVLFSVGPGGTADIALPDSLHGISQVMVSPEPDGGSPAPTHSAVIVATLT